MIGFVPGASGFRAQSSRPALQIRTSNVRTVPSRKRGVLKMAAEYWQGEWVCIDCGYIYSPAEVEKFEDLPPKWRCPQCRAPKRRFAKKAGDMVSDTTGTSNAQIALFSFIGLLATVLFGIWAANYL